MRSIMRAAIAAAAVLTATGANAANLPLNGSFESPTVAVGGFTDFVVGGSTLTDWSVIGPPLSNVSIVSGTFSQNGVTFNAQNGVQWLDLTGDGSNSTEGVEQIVSTTAGHNYQLSFYVGNTTGGSIFGTTSTVKVSINGGSSTSFTNSNADATGLNWQQFTLDFISSGSSTTIDFVNGDPTGDNSNGLDNVLLTDLGAVSAVPLPSALPLFATGLGALGLLGWRRKRKAAPLDA